MLSKSGLAVPHKGVRMEGDCTHTEDEVRTAEMVDFLRRWYRRGGGQDSDILLRFGLSARSYFMHMQGVLEQTSAGSISQISKYEIAAMKRVCRARIWLSDPGSTVVPDKR